MHSVVELRSVDESHLVDESQSVDELHSVDVTNLEVDASTQADICQNFKISGATIW